MTTLSVLNFSSSRYVSHNKCLKKLAVLHAAKLQALESQQQQQWLRPDRQAVKAGSSSVSSDERHEDGNRSCSATVGSQVEHKMHYRRRVGIAAALL